MLNRALRGAGASLDLQIVLGHIGRAAMELASADWSQIFVPDPGSGLMVARYWAGGRYAGRGRADRPVRVAPGQGAAGIALATGRPFRTDNYLEDPRLSGDFREIVREEGLVALLAVPIGARGEIDGLLCVGNESPRPFNARHGALLERLGQRVAPAVRNAHGHVESERRQRAAERLLTLQEGLSQSLDGEQVAREVCEGALALLGARAAIVSRVDAQTHVLDVVAAAGRAGGALRAGATLPVISISQLAVQAHGATSSPDVLKDPRMSLPPSLRAHLARSPRRALLSVPLRARGTIVGVLCVRDLTGRIFDEQDIGLAEAFAAQAAIALDNARLYAEMAARGREAEEMAWMVAEVSGSLEVEAVTQRIVRSALRMTGARVAALRLAEPGGLLRVVATAGETSEAFALGRAMPATAGVAGQALAMRRPFWASDVLGSPDVHLPEAEREALARSGLGSILAVPIAAGEPGPGALLVADRTGRGYSRAEATLLTAFAGHAALAIRNAQLFQEIERRRRVAEALADAQRLISRSLDGEEVGRAICERVRALFGARSSLLLRVDQEADGVVVVAGSGDLGTVLAPGLAIPRGAALSHLVLRLRRTAQSPGLLSDSRVQLPAELRDRLAKAPDQAVLCVPLIAQGEIIGLLSIRDSAGRHFDADEIAVAEAFASQAVTALSNARLFAESERRRRVAESLAAVGQMISRSFEPVEVGRGICEAVRRLLAGRGAALYRLESDTGDLVGVVTSGDTGWDFEAPSTLPRGAGLVGLATAERRPVASPNVLVDPRLTITPELRRRAEAASFRAGLAVPLLVSERGVGALVIVDAEGRRFTADEIAMVQAFAAHAAVIWENTRLVSEMERRAHQTEIMTDLTRSITGPVEDVDALLGRVVQSACELTACEWAVIALREPGSEDVVWRYGSHEFIREYIKAKGGVRVVPGRGIGGRVLDTGRPVRVSCPVEEAAAEPGDISFARDHGMRAMMAVPIRRAGRVAGLLYVGSLRERSFTDQDEAVLVRLGAQAALGIHNAELYAQVLSHRQQLAALADELGRAQEVERRRLSREIHDAMGQTLSAIQISLQIAREDMAARPEAARGRIDGAMAAIKEALGEVRRISNDLRPLVLDELGLGPAFERHVERVGALTGLAVDLSIEGRSRRLPPGVETLLYRALQETLANVVKHARAGRVRCRLECRGAGAMLTVEDDGVGFVPEAVLESAWKEGRLGLLGLRERIRTQGGAMTIESTPGRGVRVRVELPLPGAEVRGGDSSERDAG